MYRSLILTTVFTFIASSAYALDVKDVVNLDRFAAKKQEEVLKACSKMQRKDWFERYHDIEIDVVEKLEEIGAKGIEDRENNEDFWDFVKIVFPQQLPENFPLKGGFQTCGIWFSKFEHAKKASEANSAIAEFDDCMKSSYKTDTPDVLAPFLACVKNLK